MKAIVQTGVLKASQTHRLRVKMLELYEGYYKVDRESFFKRFETNDYYAIYTSNEKLVGFTGFRMRTIDTPEGKVETLYIGQTVMDSNFRGHSMIPRTCVRLLMRHYLRRPFRPIYVWCDSLTFKPYLLFANSLKKFYPNRHADLPSKVKSILDQLGKHYYGEKYDSATGTVRKAANVISDPTATITVKDRQNPDIDFFARANANYQKGHGLLTIAPMDYKNFLFLTIKCIKKIMRIK